MKSVLILASFVSVLCSCTGSNNEGSTDVIGVDSNFVEACDTIAVADTTVADTTVVDSVK